MPFFERLDIAVSTTVLTSLGLALTSAGLWGTAFFLDKTIELVKPHLPPPH